MLVNVYCWYKNNEYRSRYYIYYNVLFVGMWSWQVTGILDSVESWMMLAVLLLVFFLHYTF
jgi:hypothetical protein